MDEAEFLIRHKLTSKTTAASKQRAEEVHAGTGASQATIQKTTDTLKYVFVTENLFPWLPAR